MILPKLSILTLIASLAGAIPCNAVSHQDCASTPPTSTLATSHRVPKLKFSGQGEYLIVTGGPTLVEWEKFKAHPHDKYWGNFVRASRVRIQQLRAEYGPSFPITWLVYRRGYERRQQRQDKTDLISNIKSVRDKYHVKLVWFDSGPQLLEYINGGSIPTASAQPRESVKIIGFEYFGHSNKACFMFDFSNEIDSASKAYLHEDELKQIQKRIFISRPYIKSWGCYTAQSMSRKWRAATGHRMIGAIGKTDYANGYLNGGSLPSASRWGG